MSMTLRLDEKELVQSFKTLEPSTRTISRVLILLYDQRLRSTSGLHALGVSNFLSCLLPKHFYPDFMICRRVSSHRSVVVNRFGSLGFRSFKLPSYTFSQSAFTRSQRSFDACLLESMVEMHSILRAFGSFRPNTTYHLFPLWHDQSLECTICHHVEK